MNVSQHEDENFINTELSKISDGLLFQTIANELSQAFNVQWITQADGLDQRYWDFKFKGVFLTLHLEHYLGISIFANKSKVDIEIASRVISEIRDHFTTWNPST